MEYNYEVKDQDAHIKMNGRLTFNDHAKLRAMIKEMLQSSSKRQILDMTNLEFVDSAGIGMLLIAREELNNVDKQFVLRNATGQVKRVLTVAQLGKLITIED
ncbi:MAG: STAS domain-containing protein [Rhodospirillaceae bacterium]